MQGCVAPTYDTVTNSRLEYEDGIQKTPFDRGCTGLSLAP